MKTYWVKAADGSRLRLEAGSLYAQYSIKQPGFCCCVFEFKGVAKRRGIGTRADHSQVPYGHEMWFVEREFLAHFRKRRYDAALPLRGGRKKYRFSRVAPAELPLFMNLKHKYPAWDRWLG